MKRDVPSAFRLSVRYIVFHARKRKNGGDGSSSCCVDVAVEAVLIDLSSCCANVADGAVVLTWLKKPC